LIYLYSNVLFYIYAGAESEGVDGGISQQKFFLRLSSPWGK